MTLSAEDLARKKRIEAILASFKSTSRKKKFPTVPKSPVNYHPGDVAAAKKVLETLLRRREDMKRNLAEQESV